LTQELVSAFHREHQRLYSYHLPNAPVELVNLRVTAVGLLPRLQPRHAGTAASDLNTALAEVRPVYFDRRGSFVDTPCYKRSGLVPGMTFEGPAVVDQDDTTTVIFPDFQARVDAGGNLILARRAA
jgi:N-methylhydantoinase A